MPRARTFPELYDDDWLAEREPYGAPRVAAELGCGESTAGLALAGYRRRQRIIRQRVAVLPPSASSVAHDVGFRVDQDWARNQPPTGGQLAGRFAAVLGAQGHDTPFPLRDALIDLAATAQAWAGRLPTPSVSASQPLRTR